MWKQFTAHLNIMKKWNSKRIPKMMHTRMKEARKCAKILRLTPVIMRGRGHWEHAV